MFQHPSERVWLLSGNRVDPGEMEWGSAVAFYGPGAVLAGAVGVVGSRIPSLLEGAHRARHRAGAARGEPWLGGGARALGSLPPGIAEGEPLFRSIKKGGDIRGRFRDGGVSLALKARVARYLQACGYTEEAAAAAKYSGHSGRVGMYTAASEAGIAIEAVAALARHKSLRQTSSSVRRQRTQRWRFKLNLSPC